MTVRWTVRAANDQGAQFAPRVTVLQPLPKKAKAFCLGFLFLGGLEVGAVVNDSLSFIFTL